MRKSLTRHGRAKLGSDDLARRIAALADRFESRESAAVAAGISPSQLQRILKGESSPTFETLARLSAAAGVSLDWLSTGVGTMEKGAQGALVRSREELAKAFLIPRYDVRASAGHGALIESEQIVDHVAFKLDFIRRTINPSSPNNLVLISAIGDSMTPAIETGDLLLVDTGDSQIRDHAIYALTFGGQLVVKRLQRKRDGGVLIISDNSAYKTEEVPPNEVSSLRIVGRVVWAGGLI